MARPKGSTQTRPTTKDIMSYYRLLKSAAEEGDHQAAAALIELNILEETRRASAGGQHAAV